MRAALRTMRARAANHRRIRGAACGFAAGGVIRRKIGRFLSNAVRRRAPPWACRAADNGGLRVAPGAVACKNAVFQRVVMASRRARMVTAWCGPAFAWRRRDRSRAAALCTTCARSGGSAAAKPGARVGPAPAARSPHIFFERGDVRAKELLVAVDLGAAAHGIEGAEWNVGRLRDRFGGPRIELRLAEDGGHLFCATTFSTASRYSPVGVEPGKGSMTAAMLSL